MNQEDKFDVDIKREASVLLNYLRGTSTSCAAADHVWVAKGSKNVLSRTLGGDISVYEWP